MTYSDIQNALACELMVAADDFDTLDIQDVVVSDLMSDVLTVEEEDFVLVTSLASEQVIRTADIVSARGIILVNGKRPSDGMLELARADNISLLTTSTRTFAACVKLVSLIGS